MDNELEVVLLSFFLCVGLLGNLIAVAVIHQNPRLQNLHNALVINLVSIDLLVLVFCVFPVITSYTTNQWMLGNPFCQFSGYLIASMSVASLWNIVALSIYRYLLLRKPIWYAYAVTKKFMLILIVTIWLISFVTSALVSAVGTFRYLPEFHICFPGFKQAKSNIAVLTILVFVPTLFLVLLTIVVSVTIHSHKRKAKKQSFAGSFTSDQQENKAAYTYLLLVLMLVLCWGPLLVIHTLNLVKAEMLNQSLYTFTTFAGFLPFMLKPLIYFFTKAEIRYGVAKICKKCFRIKTSSIHPADGKMSRKNPVIRIQKAWQEAILESATHF